MELKERLGAFKNAYGPSTSVRQNEESESRSESPRVRFSQPLWGCCAFALRHVCSSLLVVGVVVVVDPPPPPERFLPASCLLVSEDGIHPFIPAA